MPMPFLRVVAELSVATAPTKTCRCTRLPLPSTLLHRAAASAAVTGASDTIYTTYFIRVVSKLIVAPDLIKTPP